MVEGLTLVKSEVDTNLNHWTGSQYYDWSPIGGGNYTLRWTGVLWAPETGEYGVGTISDDGSQVWIDGRMVLDNGQGQWYDWQEVFVLLNAGYHAFELRFYDSGVYSGIQLWWLLPSQQPSTLPYSGDTFHGVPPTRNADTKWEFVPKEVLATEPPVPFPVLTCLPRPLTGEIELRWMSSAQAKYRILFSENLVNWSSLEGDIPGTGDWVARTRTAGKVLEFYRLEATRAF